MQAFEIVILPRKNLSVIRIKRIKIYSKLENYK